MSLHNTIITPALYQYILDLSLQELDVQKRLRAITASQFPESCHMQIGPEQGQFMRFLLELMNARTILEIGTFTGYSALSMALALPSDGQLITCDIDDQFKEIAHEFWALANLQNIIQLKIAPALDTMQKLLSAGKQESFDAIFIDADKTNYLNYYELGLNLLRQGGLIMVDNVFRSGAVVDPEDHRPNTLALREFNAALHQDRRIELNMVMIGDGLTLARKI